MQFILWNPAEPGPHYDGEHIVSSGVIGRVGPDNVYLTAYGVYPDERRPADLKVGEVIRGVEYRLSGQRGIYDIYRVA